MQLQPSRHTVRAATTVLVAVFTVTMGLPVVASPATAGQADTTHSISECGPLDESGEYVLAENITADGDCFDVTADDVTLDGDGHVVTGPGNGTAVAASGVEDLTVSNVTMAEWSTGASLSDVAYTRLNDTTVTNASVVGVSVENGSRTVTVSNSTVENGTTGVRVDTDTIDVAITGSQLSGQLGAAVHLRGEDVRVADNEIRETGGAGIEAVGSTDATIAGNDVRNTIGGITVSEAGGVVVRANTLRDVRGTSILVDGTGEMVPAAVRPKPTARNSDVRLQPPMPSSVLGGGAGANSSDIRRVYVDVTLVPPSPAAPVQVADNDVLDGNGIGILLNGTDGATAEHNMVARNRDGVRVAGGERVTVADTLAVENRDDGISFAASARGVARNNTLHGNADDGLYVVSDGATVASNEARANGDDGIDVHNSSVVAVRSNNVSENGDDGLYFRTVTGGTVEANNATRNDDDGIDLRNSHALTVANNTLCENLDDDIIQRQGSNATVRENSHC
ncbi:MAG: right-handed parallel beta-helix repeat-containing protein [Halolamina sp.]